MTDKPRRIRVKDVVEQPPHEQVRKIGRALIALARAQLEAEAQAQAQAQQEAGQQEVRDQTGDAA